MLVNFLGALAAPRLSRRHGNKSVLTGASAISLAGMAWLGQIEVGAPLLTRVALPMLLVGAGMGTSLALLTIAGVAGVPREEAGSASGLVGVAHQLGGAFGLAVLVVVFAASGPTAGGTAKAELAHHIGMALSGGAVLMALAWVLVLAFVLRNPAAARPSLNGSAR